MDIRSLFRNEALEYMQAQNTDVPRLASPLSLKIFSAFIAMLIIASGCLFYWGTYTRKQMVHGYLISSKHVITVNAPQTGVVVKSYVELGDHVHKNQKLYLISSNQGLQQDRKSNATTISKRLQYQALQKFIVRSPIEGVVAEMIVRPGKKIADESPLLNIIPQGAIIEGQLLVPAHSIGALHPGETVRFSYNAFPYRRFGFYRGQVKAVSRSVIMPGSLETPIIVHELYYLVTISLEQPYVQAYGQRVSLVPGMTLSADIVIRREHLYEWVLDPLANLRGGP